LPFYAWNNKPKPPARHVPTRITLWALRQGEQTVEASLVTLQDGGLEVQLFCDGEIGRAGRKVIHSPLRK
jgi:hypothetical protein